MAASGGGVDHLSTTRMLADVMCVNIRGVFGVSGAEKLVK